MDDFSSSPKLAITTAVTAELIEKTPLQHPKNTVLLFQRLVTMKVIRRLRSKQLSSLAWLHSRRVEVTPS